MVKSCSSMLSRWLVFTLRVLVPSTTFLERGLPARRQRGARSVGRLGQSFLKVPPRCAKFTLPRF